MSAPASFGGWLKLRRKALDLTQDGLARAVGCSLVTIRKLESDERRPSRQIAERLADCLRIGPGERAAFIGMARAEPYLDEAPAADQTPSLVPPRARSNLPRPLTRLIGRKQEVAALRGALLRGDTRMLTLVGPPGIGKTRLALHVAGELRDAFGDGVYFVDLSAVRDPDLVIGAIAQALGLQELGGRPLGERLHDYLHDRRLLLLLDNFEQVVEAAPLVVGLLEDCSGVKALVTSRAALRVRGEQVVPVAALPLVEPAEAPAVRVVAQNPAVALFVERAQAAMPGFALTETNAPPIAELCARLDGLPLAIELVAMRVRLLPPAALLAGLDRRLALLTDGPRDLPARHQTLRAALAGSYELLDAPAQALFPRLGVLVGSFTLEAVEAIGLRRAAREVAADVAPPAPASPPIASLGSLVEHSLVAQPAPSDAAPRFTMLETIREYALELLAERGDLAAAQHAHAAYFLDLAERAATELHGQDQATWLDRLEAEYPNMRAALSSCLGASDGGLGPSGGEQTAASPAPHAPSRAEIGLRLAGALGWFWFVRGSSGEGRRWLDRALEAGMPLLEGTPPEQAARGLLQAQVATALHAAGRLALFQGDFAPARARLDASLAIWRELTARAPADRTAQRGLVTALTFLIVVVQFQGDGAARQPLVEEYQALSRTLDDPYARAMVLFSLGRGALLQLGDYVAARASLEQSLALFRALGDAWSIAQVVIDLGLVALYQEDYAAAQAWNAEGLALARGLRDRMVIATALNNLGEVARCQDDDERAALSYAESLQLHQDLGNAQETPRLLHNLGYVALRRGDVVRATAYFREGLGRFRQLGMTRGIAENLAGLAAVSACRGQPAAAARLWGAAEALHETDGTPVWPADRREHARYQAIARAQLDATAWQDAWQIGRADPLAQPMALE